MAGVQPAAGGAGREPAGVDSSAGTFERDFSGAVADSDHSYAAGEREK